MSNEAEEEAASLVAGWYFSPRFIALVNVARAAGLISIIGSSAIVVDICKKKAFKSTKNLILLLMSIFDIMFAIFIQIAGTLMLPEGTAWGAIGSWQSCTVQGFSLYFFVAPACFLNANLSMYYVLCVLWGWKEEQFRRPLIQMWTYGMPLILGSFIAIWGLVDGAYTISVWSCSLSPSPLGCKQMPEVVGQCTRGINANTIEMVWTVLLFIFSFIIVISVAILYRAVLKQERALDRYTARHSGEGFFNAGVYFRKSGPSHAQFLTGVWRSIKNSVRSSISIRESVQHESAMPEEPYLAGSEVPNENN
ncbi:hypothetical protein ACHAWO_007988 [Cyclotella atomus]|uniref:G-protein coupled receptors family 2 profile 2 domain-containing protein n=1 Tax=Cyclotella atomus TaxID=382360 RepID=A0ABD3PEQ0_9STRA